MLVKPEYEFLKTQYDTVRLPVGRAITSIINSILYQRRIVFCMTRRLTEEMVRSDGNHEDSIAFRHECWPAVIGKLCGNKFIREVRKGLDGMLSIWEVVDPELLSFLQDKSRDEQLQETIQFVEKSRHGGDRNGDQGNKEKSKVENTGSRKLEDQGSRKLKNKKSISKLSSFSLEEERASGPAEENVGPSVSDPSNLTYLQQNCFDLLRSNCLSKRDQHFLKGIMHFSHKDDLTSEQRMEFENVRDRGLELIRLQQIASMDKNQLDKVS